MVRSSWHAEALRQGLALRGGSVPAAGSVDPLAVLHAPQGLLEAVKAMEALDRVGWEHASTVLPRLPASGRAAEAPAVAAALRAGEGLRGMWTGDEELLEALSCGKATAVLEALAEGATEEDVAGSVALLAASRLQVGLFVHCNALHQGLRRLETLGAAPDALLDAVIVAAGQLRGGPVGVLAEEPRDLEELSFADADEAAAVTSGFLLGGGSPDALMERMVELLLRAPASLPHVLCLDAAVQQYRFRRNTPEGVRILVCAARYLSGEELP